MSWLRQWFIRRRFRRACQYDRLLACGTLRRADITRPHRGWF